MRYHWRLIALIVCLAGATMPALAHDDGKNATAETVFNGMDQNRAKITSGYIRWTKRTVDNNFSRAGLVEMRGDYEMWWQNEKLATRSWEQHLTMPEENATRPVVDWTGRWTAYDGKEFSFARFKKNKPGELSDIERRGEPEYEGAENWFIVGKADWHDIYHEMTETLTEMGHQMQWSLGPDQAGGKKGLVYLTVGASDGARLVHTFDPEKAYNLTRVDMFGQKGDLMGETAISYSEVLQGAWFPTKVEEKTYNFKRKLLLNNLYEVDLKTSSFNDPSKLPPEMFQISKERAGAPSSKAVETPQQSTTPVKSAPPSLRAQFKALIAGAAGIVLFGLLLWTYARKMHRGSK